MITHTKGKVNRVGVTETSLILHGSIPVYMQRQRMHLILGTSTVIYTIMIYRTAPLLRPPLLRPTFKKKRGGGVTTRTCAFASQLSPPPPSTNSRTL